MDQEEYSLDYDSISSFSSLSSCSLNDDVCDDMEDSRIVDLVSLGERSSTAEPEPAFHIELDEDIMNTEICHLRQTFWANNFISGHRTILSDDLTFETIITDDDSCIVPTDDDASVPFEVQSDEDSDCENDNEFVNLNLFSHQSSKPQHQEEDLVESNTSFHFSNGNTASFTIVAVNKLPSANSTPENEKIHRARARRAEALKRYHDVLKNGSSSSSAHGPLHRHLTEKRQESLKLADTNEATEGDTYPPKAAIDNSRSFKTSASRRSSIKELRSRQRKSLQGLLNAIDAVRDPNISTNYYCYKMKPIYYVRKQRIENTAI